MITIFGVFLVILVIFIARTYYLNRGTLPGPFALPIVGNIHQLGLNSVDYLHNAMRLIREYPPRLRFWVTGTYYIVLSDPKDVEPVLSNSSPNVLYKTDVYEYLKPWLGDGLLISSGSKWHKHRKMITPSFHFNILKDFLEIMNNTADKFVNKLGTQANGQIFDIQQIVHKSTLDVICETAMGSEMNALDDRNVEIVNAINDLCFITSERIFSALQRSDLLFKLTPSYWKQQRSLKILKEYMKKIIKERREIISRRKLVEEDPSASFYVRRKMAFLDNLLTAQIDGRSLRFQEIFDEVSTFLFEGHDTTASALTFSFLCISRHPEVQQKIYEEQMELSNGETNWRPRYEDIQNMKYLELVIKETLRLFPSVPFICRTLLKADEINNVKIPANTTFVISLISMGYNPTYFKDPCTFNPDRYTKEARAECNVFDSVPFSAGPRNCIGQKFAVMEIKTFLSKVVRHFEILPPENGMDSKGIFDLGIRRGYDLNPRSKWDPTLCAALTLKAYDGLFIRLRKRDHK